MSKSALILLRESSLDWKQEVYLLPLWRSVLKEEQGCRIGLSMRTIIKEVCGRIDFSCILSFDAFSSTRTIPGRQRLKTEKESYVYFRLLHFVLAIQEATTTIYYYLLRITMRYSINTNTYVVLSLWERESTRTRLSRERDYTVLASTVHT